MTFVPDSRETRHPGQFAINGVRLTAEAEETYIFLASLDEANQPNFDNLIPWRLRHVSQDPHAARRDEVSRLLEDLKNQAIRS